MRVCIRVCVCVCLRVCMFVCVYECAHVCEVHPLRPVTLWTVYAPRVWGSPPPPRDGRLGFAGRVQHDLWFAGRVLTDWYVMSWGLSRLCALFTSWGNPLGAPL